MTIGLLRLVPAARVTSCFTVSEGAPLMVLKRDDTLLALELRKLACEREYGTLAMSREYFLEERLWVLNVLQQFTRIVATCCNTSNYVSYNGSCFFFSWRLRGKVVQRKIRGEGRREGESGGVSGKQRWWSGIGSSVAYAQNELAARLSYSVKLDHEEP